MTPLCPVGETYALNYTSHHACWTTGRPRDWIRHTDEYSSRTFCHSTGLGSCEHAFFTPPCLPTHVWLSETETHTHTHTPLHTQTLFKALFFCFFVLLFFLLVFSYSIFIFMHATPGGCSFTWVYWNISALPQHEAKHYEWLPVCLAIVPLTSLRRLQASVTLGSFLYTCTYTHIAVNTTLKAIAARTRTHTQSPL